MPALATLKHRWFWYSLLCVLCWGGWALCSKLGSDEIPAPTMQFIFTLGAFPIGLGLLVAKRFKMEKSPKGIFYGVANGILSGVGGLALFAAYRAGGNTGVITAATGLYPMFTVLLAVLILRERLNKLQILGLGFAVAAILIFSLTV